MCLRSKGEAGDAGLEATDSKEDGIRCFLLTMSVCDLKCKVKKWGEKWNTSIPGEKKVCAKALKRANMAN